MPTKSKIDLLKEKVNERDRPPQIMNYIIEIFGESGATPIPGSYSTFIYTAKTPKLLYDKHPLIAVLDLEEWGFRGFNFHLNSHRNYNWSEVQSIFCPIEGSEISYLRTLKYRTLVKNR